MGNLGGGELLVILMLGLLVLGPSRLAVVVQQVGRLVGQARRLATGIQEEFREIVEDPTLEAAARARGAALLGPDSEHAGSERAESDEPETSSPEGAEAQAGEESDEQGSGENVDGNGDGDGTGG